VKTALLRGDPNLGAHRPRSRFRSARGWIPKPGRSTLGGHTWVERGAIEAMSEAEAHHFLEEQTVEATLDLGLGDATATAWGCDLTG